MDNKPSILRVKSEESEKPVGVLLKEEAILKKNSEIARENRGHGNREIKPHHSRERQKQYKGCGKPLTISTYSGKSPT